MLIFVCIHVFCIKEKSIDWKFSKKKKKNSRDFYLKINPAQIIIIIKHSVPPLPLSFPLKIVGYVWYCQIFLKPKGAVMDKAPNLACLKAQDVLFVTHHLKQRHVLSEMYKIQKSSTEYKIQLLCPGDLINMKWESINPLMLGVLWGQFHNILMKLNSENK